MQEAGFILRQAHGQALPDRVARASARRPVRGRQWIAWRVRVTLLAIDVSNWAHPVRDWTKSCFLVDAFSRYFDEMLVVGENGSPGPSGDLRENLQGGGGALVVEIHEDVVEYSGRRMPFGVALEARNAQRQVELVRRALCSCPRRGRASRNRAHAAQHVLVFFRHIGASSGEGAEGEGLKDPPARASIGSSFAARYLFDRGPQHVRANFRRA